MNLKVHSLEGFPSTPAKIDELGTPSAAIKSGELGRVTVKLKWRGSRGGLRTPFSRSIKRARTTEKVPEDGCTINWEEDFEHVCVLTMTKDSNFLPWDVRFVIIQVGAKSKLTVIGTATMNLADFASPTENARQTTKVPIYSRGATDSQSALLVTVNFIELRTRETSSALDRFMSPSLPCITGPLWDKNDQQQGKDTSERKSKSAKRSVLANGKKNSGELEVLYSGGKLSPRSEQSSAESGDLFDSDSLDESEEEVVPDEEDYHFQSYGHLAGVNLVVEGALSCCRQEKEHQQHTLTICTKAPFEGLPKALDETSASESDQAASPPTGRSILPWKRKLSFRSPRVQRGEPLLNKAYGEDGGDDIDHDRRLSSSPIESLLALCQKSEDGSQSANISGCLDFGDEHFSVGSWEKKDLVSRDGQMKLSANIFSASIDQRSERAAGESACTALVAVIADWLHQNPDRMPIKAEFDTLIREGSAEWRKLCDNETYRDRFPDRHFDLDTVLQAKVRPLVVAPERSFVGFFQPEGFDDSCNFLHGAMSFDNIWEEVVSVKPDGSFEPAVYIVSWNDHFFVLKVDREACFIIDTLGERLYEGCNQAYILAFDGETNLCHVPKSEGLAEETPSSGSSSSTTVTSISTTSAPSIQMTTPQQSTVETGSNHQRHEADQCGFNSQNIENTVVYKGKDACKQFIKGFFAALPLRELQSDIKKGLLGKIPLHQRLQIEFHFTSSGLGPLNIGSEKTTEYS